jgi:hypothetical protein
VPRHRDPEPRSCPGPIICFAVPGEYQQIGQCRCGLIVVGVGYDDMPADHQHAALLPEGLTG